MGKSEKFSGKTSLCEHDIFIYTYGYRNCIANIYLVILKV